MATCVGAGVKEGVNGEGEGERWGVKSNEGDVDIAEVEISVEEDAFGGCAENGDADEARLSNISKSMFRR